MVHMKFILNSLILAPCSSSINASHLSDELLVLHNVNTAEIYAISSPMQDSVLFNTDDNEVYERNATSWNIISNYDSEPKVVAGNCMDITGISTTVGQYVTINLSKEETQTTTASLDGCTTNRTDSLHTIIDISDTRIPLLNVYSKDNGGTTETFGSPPINNLVWFR